MRWSTPKLWDTGERQAYSENILPTHPLRGGDTAGLFNVVEDKAEAKAKDIAVFNFSEDDENGWRAFISIIEVSL